MATTKRIVCKDTAREILKEVALEDISPVADVWKSLGETKETAYLVFKGRILEEEWLTLAEAFGDIQHPIVYVIKKRAFKATSEDESETVLNRENRVLHSEEQNPVVERVAPSFGTVRSRASEVPVSQSQQSEEVRCRICYSSESTPDDRLFRPCLCRGSIGLVHISCLNAWREQPENPDAYFRCPNCGYDYRIARTRYAQWLNSEEFAQAGAVVFMLCLIVVLALASWIAVPKVIIEKFYNLIEWSPPDDTYPFVRYLLFGAACLGLSRFLLGLRHDFLFVWHHGSVHALFAIIMSLTANGTRGLRIFSFVGLAVTYSRMYLHSQRLSRRLLTSFGERVLEVTE